MYFSVVKTSKNKDKSDMNEKFENQKEKLISIKQEISLLYQQINYLLRNGKALELLDLDVLMNRTHTLYDLLCSIDLGDEAFDEEDLPFDADALAGLFGGMTQEMPEAQPDEAPEVPQEDETPVEVPEETFEDEEQTIENQEETMVEEEGMEVDDVPFEVEQPVEEVPAPVPDEATEAPKEGGPLGDEYGFFFRFEDIPERKEEQPEETMPSDELPVAENVGKVVHVVEEIPMEEIPERDRVHGDDLVKDNPLEMPEMEDEQRFDYEKPVTDSMSDFFDNDDADFELSTPETLGEKMMHEDHSLAAKLQQNPVRDLKSVIGINDKFLFVNELFGGSMEKYNKSIENLNDLKTLNGALIYLNELKIELQWNSSNEAYQKLKDLISRKFE